MDEAPRRVVVLHGFTQTHHHVLGFAHLLARRLDERAPQPTTLVLPDLPGHGLSAQDPDGIDAAADALVPVTAGAIVVGYSMGGRVALHTALAPGSSIERLVLIGATAGIEDDGERAERCRLDAARADHVEQVGVDRFVEEWLQSPLFATLPDGAAGIAHRRRNTAAGLAHSLRTSGTGAQRSRWDEVGDIDVPVLVIAGELDAKFTALGRRLAAAVPDGTFVSIEGAGHAAQTERPGAVATAIADWITSTTT